MASGSGAAGRSGSESATCSDEVPDPIRTNRGNVRSQLAAPKNIVAELVTPGPGTPGKMMQLVLMGKAHGSVHLVRNFCHNAGCLANPGLGRSDLYPLPGIAQRCGGGVCRSHGGRNFSRQYG